MHGLVVSQEAHDDVRPLSDPPRAAARLAQSVNRISRLHEIDGGRPKQVQPNRNESRMSHAHLHSVAKLALIPRLALIGRHLSREYGDPDAFLRQNAFETTRYVPLRRVYGINLAFSAAGEVRLDALHQLALLRVGEVLTEVLRLSDQKRQASMQLRVVL